MTDDQRYLKTLVRNDMTILDAIKIIDDATFQIALVVDKDQTLLGTVTDGDVRRGIIKGVKLDEPVTKIMGTTPVTITQDTPKAEVVRLMSDLQIHQIPIIDANRRIVGLRHLDDYVGKTDFEPIPNKDIWVVLMLGGEGTRLHPLTQMTPKPMLDIGGRPLLETIVRNFADQGFRRFFFSVKYKAELIERHFGDGEKFGIDITYLREDMRMGTAGALSLLPEKPTAPIIVMNGDILTNNNFSHLVSFHRQTGAAATMCVREYQQQVPYGIIQSDGTKLKSIVEKPTHSYFVNAGIYIIDPLALDYVPTASYFDMPQLFETIAAADLESSVFPIREYWRDIGRIEDLEQARSDYKAVFGS